MRFHNKKKLIVVLLIVAGVGGGWTYHTQHKNSAIPNADYIHLQKNNIQETVSAQGVIETRDFVEVGAQISGQVKKMYFQAGDAVKKGDLLAVIDPVIYQSKVQADQAHIRTLNAQLRQQLALSQLAKQQFDRNQLLMKADAISKEAMETSESNLKAANSAVDSYKSQIQEEQYNLQSDEANLTYTKIYAPMDGIVVTLAIREGQTINSNQQAPIILSIANLDVMRLHAQVTEADVTKLSPGMPVYFNTLGSAGRRWQGTIRRIMPASEPGTIPLYGALIDVGNEDKKLMPGMSAQVFFVLSSVEDVPTLPLRVLGEHVEDKDDETGQAYMVMTKTGDKLVRIGLTDRINAEVKAGLGPDDEILVPAKPAS